MFLATGWSEWFRAAEGRGGWTGAVRAIRATCESDVELFRLREARFSSVASVSLVLFHLLSYHRARPPHPAPLLKFVVGFLSLAKEGLLSTISIMVTTPRVVEETGKEKPWEGSCVY